MVVVVVAVVVVVYEVMMAGSHRLLLREQLKPQGTSRKDNLIQFEHYPLIRRAADPPAKGPLG